MRYDIRVTSRYVSRNQHPLNCATRLAQLMYLSRPLNSAHSEGGGFLVSCNSL